MRGKWVAATAGSGVKIEVIMMQGGTLGCSAVLCFRIPWKLCLGSVVDTSFHRASACGGGVGGRDRNRTSGLTTNSTEEDKYYVQQSTITSHYSCSTKKTATVDTSKYTRDVELQNIWFRYARVHPSLSESSTHTCNHAPARARRGGRAAGTRHTSPGARTL